eukprot:CAMPEP_0113581860 /NCGR_PEP_ID=MMETSP0015_2-20120614/31561_1 /TAXON_ID=2838 /ORGANISM="Odontella" /LENGTH=213 /DNA_ID=CAMNT_0000486403 /DNA_START=60 /DNA_END=701 /DNA_ORIENTATION=- /assembly_acc=CAM_ASM_000160
MDAARIDDHFTMRYLDETGRDGGVAPMRLAFYTWTFCTLDVEGYGDDEEKEEEGGEGEMGEVDGGNRSGGRDEEEAEASSSSSASAEADIPMPTLIFPDRLVGWDYDALPLTLTLTPPSSSSGSCERALPNDNPDEVEMVVVVPAVRRPADRYLLSRQDECELREEGLLDDDDDHWDDDEGDDAFDANENEIVDDDDDDDDGVHWYDWYDRGV